MAQQKEGQHALWVAFKSGEEKAFAQLFFTYYEQLFHYGKKITANEALVKDVLQDFFLYLFESRNQLANELSNLTAYLIISFRRRLLQELQTRQTEKDQLAQKTLSDDYLFELGQEEIIIKHELVKHHKQLITQLLQELPPRQREIIYLKYYMDLSLPEIAEALSISYQVVANHLYRALKKLQHSNSSRKFFKLGFWLVFTFCSLSIF